MRDERYEWCSIASKIGCAPETLRTWVRRVEVDAGRRDGVTGEERTRIKQLEREVFELRRANGIFRKASFFRPSGARPSTKAMTALVDEHCGVYGVEPICAMLPIASSTYHEWKAGEANPTRLPERIRRDIVLCGEIVRVWQMSPIVVAGLTQSTLRQSRGG